MGRYSKYPIKENLEATDFLSGIDSLGSLRLFNNDALVDFITQIVLQYASDTDLSQNEAEAIKNALNPDATNVFVTAIELAAKLDKTITIQTHDVGFNLASGDEETYIRYTGATDITVTVQNSILTGQPITLWQAGAGKITLVGDAGVILNGNLSTAGQYTAIQIIKVADNLFDVIGGVA